MNQYEQKLNKMLNRLKETNFAAFDGDSDLALESIADNLSQFTNYHNQIIYEKTQTPILKAGFISITIFLWHLLFRHHSLPFYQNRFL